MLPCCYPIHRLGTIDAFLAQGPVAFDVRIGELPSFHEKDLYAQQQDADKKNYDRK